MKIIRKRVDSGEKDIRGRDRRKDYDFFVIENKNKIKIAYSKGELRYVKAQQTDRLRTKVAWRYDFSWVREGLVEFFNLINFNYKTYRESLSFNEHRILFKGVYDSSGSFSATDIEEHLISFLKHVGYN